MTTLSAEQKEFYDKHSSIIMAAASDSQQLLMNKYKLQRALNDVEAHLEKITTTVTESTEAVQKMISEFNIDGKTVVSVDQVTGELTFM